MHLKKFEYLHKDVPFLKKDLGFRVFFILLFIAVFAWQFISILMQDFSTSVNIPMLISSVAVLLISLMFITLNLMYSFKNFKVLSVIKKQGRCISSVDILFNTKKSGFVYLYSLITKALALVATLILVCSITYSVLQITFYANVSFYLPLLAVVCVCGYYSAYHINTEIKTVKTVQEFNSIY